MLLVWSVLCETQWYFRLQSPLIPNSLGSYRIFITPILVFKKLNVVDHMLMWVLSFLAGCQDP